jgi:hypothetical protein
MQAGVEKQPESSMEVQPSPCERVQAAEWSKITEAAALSLVLAATAWIFRGAFRCFFFQDDFAWLVLSRFHSLGEYARCFFRFNPAGTYRPLSQETFFWLGQVIFGMWPPGFHMIAMAAHLAAVLLLYTLLRQFFSPLPALAGALCYAVHGAHQISLYWISAFPEPLAMVFFLAAVLMFVRFDRMSSRSAYVFSLIAMVLGIMSKESILTLPLILATYCFIFARSRVMWVIPHLALSGTYMLLRLIARMPMAPYDLQVGRQTAGNLLAYISWMAGLSANLVQAHLTRNLTVGYLWIAPGFVVILLALFLVSQSRRVAAFSILWMAFSIQPVLYFSSHSYPYYLAPALAGLSLLIASALPPFERFSDWRGWAPALLAAGVVVWLSAATIDREGTWWIQRTADRRELVNNLLSIDRAVSGSATVYILGFGWDGFESLENGGVFKAYNIPARKFRFLMPDLDAGLDFRLKRLEQTGGLSDAYCFRLAGDTVVDQTAAFRKDPVQLLPQERVRFLELPGVAVSASPEVVYRGKDVLTLRFENLDARDIDLLYSIDGQLMPPVLHWMLDPQHTARVFADMTTPEGEYELKAVRPSGSGSARWIRIDAHLTVR